MQALQVLAGKLVRLAVAGALLFAPVASHGGLIVDDDFDPTTHLPWGNQVGNWSAAGGAYNAAAPNNLPPTYSALPYHLTDFTVEVDIRDVADGGIWLRSTDNNNGVMLITGGGASGNRGLYWHVRVNGNYGAALSIAPNLFNPGDEVTVEVVVAGDRYDAYLNGGDTPATTLIDATFAGGHVGLYDFSGQSVDRFRLGFDLPDDAIPGDADLNRTVAIRDLSILATFFGKSSAATWLEGDFNGDQAVTITDLSILATNFGRSNVPAGGSAAIPEPTTLAIGSVAALLLRRRRQ